MRKELIFPLALLGILLIFSLWSSNAMTANSVRWQMQLQQADALAADENWDGAAAALSQSYDDWFRHQTWLYMVAKHDIVDAADAMYHRAQAFAAQQEPNEFRAELADLQSQLNLLTQMEQLKLENIF